jgi:hypothetical protein
MPGRTRKEPKKPKGTAEAKNTERKTRTRRKKMPAKAKEEMAPAVPVSESAEVRKEIDMRGPVLGSPSLIQSTYGNKGNFEIVVPLTSGGLASFWRNNDDEMLPWNGPTAFGTVAGMIEGVSLIQSSFGELGNLELAAVDVGGHNLMHFWCDFGSSFKWHGPNRISEKSLVPAFSGNPAMIQSRSEGRSEGIGNFELVVPRANGGFSYYLRNNNLPDLRWLGPFDFATDAGIFNAVTLIQSNFGESGSLELVARTGDQLVSFWRESGMEAKWHGPFPIDSGVTGTPSMIQSTFGYKGNFELVAPLASGGLGHWWRDNDDAHLHWYGPFMFGTNLGKVDAVSLIQSNWGDPGHLELIAQADGQLAFFWRDSGPDFRWNGPQFITF